jgi:hypothetical protein
MTALKDQPTPRLNALLHEQFRKHRRSDKLAVSRRDYTQMCDLASGLEQRLAVAVEALDTIRKRGMLKTAGYGFGAGGCARAALAQIGEEEGEVTAVRPRPHRVDYDDGETFLVDDRDWWQEQALALARYTLHEAGCSTTITVNGKDTCLCGLAELRAVADANTTE